MQIWYSNRQTFLLIINVENGFAGYLFIYLFFGDCDIMTFFSILDE